METIPDAGNLCGYEEPIYFCFSLSLAVYIYIYIYIYTYHAWQPTPARDSLEFLDLDVAIHLLRLA